MNEKDVLEKQVESKEAAETKITPERKYQKTSQNQTYYKTENHFDEDVVVIAIGESPETKWVTIKERAFENAIENPGSFVGNGQYHNGDGFIKTGVKTNAKGLFQICKPKTWNKDTKEWK